MNFDEAFEHYQEGTATQEEKAFVLDELAKAKALSPLLDDEGVNITPAPVLEADISEIKAAKKQFKWKRLAYAGVSVVVLLVVLGAVLGGVFGAATNYAGNNIKISKADAQDIAVDFAVVYLNDTSAMPDVGKITSDDITVKGSDRSFHFETKISESYYSFDFKLLTPRFELKVSVDTKNGSCRIMEVK